MEDLFCLRWTEYWRLVIGTLARLQMISFGRALNGSTAGIW